MKIETILFDLGKVLVDFNFETGVQSLHSACSISRKDFNEVLWDADWIRRYECGEVSTQEFHEYLCHSADLQMDLPSFCETWSSVFLPDLIVSEALLAELKRNYPLILVSNTNEAHLEYIRSNYPVLDYFDHHVLSYKVGAMKPDRKIYDHAISKAGFPPQALFFTDDREENVVAARSLGMHAHQFRGEAELVSSLKQAGIDLGKH